MFEELKIIHWPDPRLLRTSKPVEQFDESLRELAKRLFVLMREAKGVGLAAPQAGVNIRMFVMNATGQEQDDRVYVNPVLSEAEGQEKAEEGCLSLPGVHVDIERYKTVRVSAQDLEGRPVDQRESGHIARIWQHECDHLNGTLLTDRMGASARMGHRKVLRELEERYAVEHPGSRKGSSARRKRRR